MLGRLDPYVGVRATAVIERDGLTVTGRRAVGAHAEHRRKRTTEPDQEAAAAAVRRCGLGDRGVRAVVAGDPALGCVFAAFDGQHTLAAEPEFTDNLADSRGLLRRRALRHR